MPQNVAALWENKTRVARKHESQTVISTFKKTVRTKGKQRKTKSIVKSLGYLFTISGNPE
jgi:hypothetical protein